MVQCLPCEHGDQTSISVPMLKSYLCMAAHAHNRTAEEAEAGRSRALEAASLDYLIDSKSTRDPISKNKMNDS